MVRFPLIGRWLAAGAFVAASGACGGTPTVSTTTTMSTTPNPYLPQIERLTTTLQAAQESTYKALYLVVHTGTPKVTLTIEQSGRDRLYAIGSAGTGPEDGATSTSGTGQISPVGPSDEVTEIVMSSAVWVCRSPAGRPQCVQSSPGSPTPLTAYAELFDARSITNSLNVDAHEYSLHTSDFTMSVTPGKFAGLNATCVYTTAGTQPTEYCITDTGVVAFLLVPGKTLTLMSLSTSVSQSDFALPAGATTSTTS